ncbi:hypothetical protein LZ012_13045 [Dechloromonas sp. XY25]|uniref:GNAT family N-acetyltransferase n=1 Tax=Dechloromonas hankyongensis TaxID=2908002 RepID=A0ABS9K430_9RHOO|nr:hypothetical protein [Dechloromonas hankyongensis]MCG2577916.1 hypothetical protein [Dechloromonas hankyongensis]
MVLTLELPVRPAIPAIFATYEQRFGALPYWLDELHSLDAQALLRLALRRGAPLAPADLPY